VKKIRSDNGSEFKNL
jgi:hypothetical protein